MKEKIFLSVVIVIAKIFRIKNLFVIANGYSRTRNYDSEVVDYCNSALENYKETRIFNR